MESLEIIIEKHTDGYVAYPLGLKGIIVGEGDTYEEALADIKSAIRFHIFKSFRFGVSLTDATGNSRTFDNPYSVFITINCHVEYHLQPPLIIIAPRRKSIYKASNYIYVPRRRPR